MKIKYYLLLLIFACLGFTSFSSAGSYTYTGSISKSISASSSTSNGNFLVNFNLPLINQNSDTISNQIDSLNCDFSNFSYGDLVFTEIRIQYSNYLNQLTNLGSLTFNGNGNYNFNIVSNSSQKLGSIMLLFIYNRPNNAINFSFDYSCTFSGNNVINQSDLSPCPTCPSCENTPSGGICSNTGTVSDLTNRVLLYTGSVSLNNSSYTNIFNYGENGAGTYCVKLSSSSPQTLTFGFANGGTTTPTNLYQLYNDQYGEVVCLYGNKPYFNAKLNSSSNTVSYEIYKLSDLYSSNVCLENECPSCPSCPSCEDCSQYQEDLLSCQEDNESLENMNSSLSDQLESCLLNDGNGCDPETDSGCVVGSQLFNLFWSHNGNDFSLPITNNLFLLSGMKASSDSGVVILGTYDSPIVDYSMDSESSERVINLVVGIFSILAGLLFVVIAGYYLKKFLNYVLFPYKK